MPTPSSRTPKYRKQTRSDGSTLAFVELGGKRIYLGPYGSKVSREAYDREVARWLALGRNSAVPTGGITVTQLIAAWFEWARHHYRRSTGEPTSTLDSTRPALRTLRYLYGDKFVNEFGPKALKAVRQFILDHGAIQKSSEGSKQQLATGRPGSRQYANTVAAQIRGVFRGESRKSWFLQRLGMAFSRFALWRRDDATRVKPIRWNLLLTKS